MATKKKVGSKGKANLKDLATLSGLMEMLLRTGVPVLEAMAATAARLSNRALGAAFLECAEEIRKGGGLTPTLKKYPNLFPAEFVALSHYGETKGVIDQTFEKLANFYARDPAVLK